MTQLNVYCLPYNTYNDVYLSYFRIKTPHLIFLSLLSYEERKSKRGKKEKKCEIADSKQETKFDILVGYIIIIQFYIRIVLKIKSFLK